MPPAHPRVRLKGQPTASTCRRLRRAASTSDEVTTPNGKGKFNTFVGGAIYWTPETGAHPTWGAPRDKWGALGWEEGKLSFPVGDELTNPDGNRKRQLVMNSSATGQASRQLEGCQAPASPVALRRSRLSSASCS
ncbi:hypothetical protein [Streptomyces platensis]|uniref:hypothetical protein n=1 Tax=Streptomyces platensis TaxID=58346 RepID=UPI00399D5CFC